MAGPLPSLPVPDEHRPVEIFVVHPPRRPYALHAILFLATIFTTLVVGAHLQFNFLTNRPPFLAEAIFPLRWIFENPARLLLGVPFSATLMLILLAHEMGHYLYCNRYGVYATLPFFLPAPTPIGTFGAFIRIKAPIPSRTALFDIGIAGPIAGFLVAVPALALGILRSRPEPALMAATGPTIGFPAIFHLMRGLLPLSNAQGGSFSLQDVYFHPIAIAAWVGMFATALNLLPSAQLDGGHILYALSPHAHRRVSRWMVLALLPLGIFYWAGWLLWVVILTVLGPRHPMVPAYPDLGRRRKLLALFALLMLLLTFMPAPFAGSLIDVIRETSKPAQASSLHFERSEEALPYP